MSASASASTDPDLILLIISSPSGAGKTTLTHRLLQEFPEFRFSVSHTTRRPRANEVDGQDYRFVDKKDFQKLIDQGSFAEWAEVHGHLYGTSLTEIERARSEDKHGVLFDVDCQGARQIKEKFPDAVGVFILPPSMDELRRRLDGRGSDNEESRRRRFEKAREEIEHYPFFDYMIVNDELQQALAELRGIVLAEGCRQWRVAAKAEALLER
ncbi:MAG: guanylate kinase [Deltaproteobacteria bacterium]|nr:guanylate kinase [Deltaproteobacteria bacterium]